MYLIKEGDVEIFKVMKEESMYHKKQIERMKSCYRKFMAFHKIPYLHSLGIVKKGEFVGQYEGLDNHHYKTMAQIMSDECTILRIEVHYLRDYLDQFPTLNRCFNNKITGKRERRQA